MASKHTTVYIYNDNFKHRSRQGFHWILRNTRREGGRSSVRREGEIHEWIISTASKLLYDCKMFVYGVCLVWYSNHLCCLFEVLAEDNHHLWSAFEVIVGKCELPILIELPKPADNYYWSFLVRDIPCIPPPCVLRRVYSSARVIFCGRAWTNRPAGVATVI